MCNDSTEDNKNKHSDDVTWGDFWFVMTIMYLPICVSTVLFFIICSIINLCKFGTPYMQ